MILTRETRGCLLSFAVREDVCVSQYASVLCSLFSLLDPPADAWPVNFRSQVRGANIHIPCLPLTHTQTRADKRVGAKIQFTGRIFLFLFPVALVSCRREGRLIASHESCLFSSLVESLFLSHIRFPSHELPCFLPAEDGNQQDLLPLCVCGVSPPLVGGLSVSQVLCR